MLESNDLNRTDTMLLTLLPDKLQNRLEGLLIDFDQIEMDKELGKGTHIVIHHLNKLVWYVCIPRIWSFWLHVSRQHVMV